MLATRFDQTPHATTTWLASMRPRLVTTAETFFWPFGASTVSTSSTSVFAKTCRTPLSMASLRKSVPVSSESTTETVGQWKPPMMTSSLMNGTSSFTCAGVSISASTPQLIAEVMRRSSSFIRSCVRATSMPPESTERSRSRYWFADCTPRSAISLLWSTGKMKFDAWPVEPPGFGNGPLSMRTMSSHPRRLRWPTRQLPTMPAPMTTTLALLGTAVFPTSLMRASLVRDTLHGTA